MADRSKSGVRRKTRQREESITLTHPVLDELHLNIAVVDQDGVILSANRRWLDFANDGDQTRTAPGMNYLHACDAAEGPDAGFGPSFAAGLRDVLGGKTELFEMEYPSGSPGRQRWFVGQAIRMPGKGQPRVVVTHTEIAPQEQARAGQRPSPAQLQTILDTIGSGIISINDQQQIVYFNHFAEEIFGYPSEEILGKPLAVLLPDSVRLAHHGYVKKFGADDEIWHSATSRTGVLTGLRKNGEEFQAEISISKLDLGSGLAFTAVISDVTHRNFIELSEREQRALAEALSSAAFTLNSTLDLNEVLDRILANVGSVVPHDGANIMLVEGAAARIVCLHGEYIQRGYHEKLLDRELPLDQFPHLHDMITTRQFKIVEDTHTDSDWVQVEGAEWVRSSLVVPICLSDQVLGFLNLDSGATRAFGLREADRLQVFAAHAAIAIRNAQFYETEHFERLLAEALQLTAETLAKSVSVDESLPVILARLQTLIGCSWAAVFLLESDNLILATSVGLPLSTENPSPTFPYVSIPLFSEPLSRGQPVVVRDVQQDHDQTSLPDLGVELRSWVGVSIVAWDVVVGYLAVGNTAPTSYSRLQISAVQSFAYQAALALENSAVVSELEVSRSSLSEAHVRLAHAAQLQVAGEIATGIAHQVNNPLTTVIAESYLLAKYLPPDSKHYESVSAIREAAYRAGTVIQRLVDFARTKPFALAPVDINQSIVSATSLLREQIEPHIARLVLNLAPDLPPVQGSEKHLQDVWLKLLLNARDAIDTPGKGEISLTTTYDKRADLIQVTIHDNGHGIPVEQLDKIFKPFYTTKDKGTGLGLSICKDVIAKHRGTIRVESTLHEGTTVLIALPVGARHV